MKLINSTIILNYLIFFIYNFSNILCENVDQNLSSVIELTDLNFYNTIDINSESEWIVAFTATWCGACKNFKPELDELALLTLRQFPKVKIARVDVDKNPALVNQFMILRLPTIYHIKGRKVRPVEIERKLSAYKNFLWNNEWKSIDYYTGLFAPFSIMPMLTFNIISYFYKLIAFVKTLPGWVISLAPLLLVGLALVHIIKNSDDLQRTSSTADKKKK